MSLPIHSPFAAPRPTTLTQAVAQARHPRNHATAQLEPHREELLRLSQAGESAESLVGGLRLLGIHIGRETMRRWLQRELGQKPTRRKRSRRLPVGFAPTMEVPSGGMTAKQSDENIIAPSGPKLAVAADASPSAELEKIAPVRRSSLTLPGETPYEALRRRLGVLDAQKAAARNAGDATESGQAAMISTPPT